MKAFSIGEADGLLDDKIYKIANLQGFTQSLVRDLAKKWTLTVPVASFIEQQAEKLSLARRRLNKTLVRNTRRGESNDTVIAKRSLSLVSRVL